MDIYDITIGYLETGNLCSSQVDGLRHVKQLPYLSVVRATQGEYLIGLDGDELSSTGEGGLFIAPAEVMQTIVHKVSPKTRYMCADWAYLDVTVNGFLRLDHIFRFPKVISPQKAEKWNTALDGLASADNVCDQKIYGYMLTKQLIQCGTFLEYANHEGIGKVCSYIHRNYSQNITVGELAEIACMSVSNFHAVFKKLVGISPTAYLINYRISVATQLLLYSKFSIGEIAAKIGIGDAYYFSRIFRNKYGISPREYRQQNRYSN